MSSPCCTTAWARVVPRSSCRSRPSSAKILDLVADERVLTLDDVLAGDPDGGVLVTFDDGYRDFHQVVLPLLVSHRVPAVLYLATGLVANGAPPSPDALTWTQLERFRTPVSSRSDRTRTVTRTSPEPARRKRSRRCVGARS